jgi:Bacterial Ig-like domain
MEAVMGMGGVGSKRIIARALLLLAGAILVPACGKTQKPGLTVTGFFPFGGSVPRQQIVYINFDRALDASTWPISFTWQDSTTADVSATVSFNATLNQIALKPLGGTPLKGGMTYTVVVLGTLKGADGSAFSGEAFQFTTEAATATNAGQPAFGGLTGAVPTTLPATASIDLSWATATDAAGDSIVYDVYMSTSSNGEDFSLPPLLSTPNATGVTVTAANGLQSGVTYFFMVRAREATSGNIEFNTTQFSATTN